MQGATGKGRFLRHLQLGHVLTNAEQFFATGRVVTLGRQAPANQADERDTNCGNGQPHWRKIKQPERARFAVTGNDDIGGRANQGDCASQQRAEGKWHQ